MKRTSDTALLTAIAFALGLALFAGLLLWRGWPAIEALYGRAGAHVAWLAVYYVVPLLCATASWWWLFAPNASPRWIVATYATWVGLAVNWLLPVAQVGGEFVKAWLVVGRGGASEPTFASVVVDKTLQVGTQVVFTIVGVAWLATRYVPAELVLGIALGMGVLTVGGLLFFRMQQRGMFEVTARLVGRFVSAARAARMNADARRVDDAVRATYQRRRQLAAAFLWRLLFRFVLVGEIVLIGWMLGLELGLIDALIIESMVQAVRAGAFLIPGGLGVQDGTLVLLGMSLGLAAEGALAIALGKRVREILVGLPALGALQLEYGRRKVTG